VGSSRNWKLHAYYEHLQTVRKILIKNCIQTNIWQFLQVCIITFKNKHNFRVFSKWINACIVSVFSFYIKAVQRFFLFILIFGKLIHGCLITRTVYLNFPFIGFFCLLWLFLLH
jgi:hypothetical protein